MQQQLVQQEADLSRLPRRAVGRAVEGQHRLNLDREQVLNRLWEIANLSPDMTRNSITGQVKAISMIVAMLNFVPDRRAVSAEKNQLLRLSTCKSMKPPARPACAGVPWSVPWGVPEPEPAPGSAAEPPPAPAPSQPTFAHRVPLADGLPPYVPLFNSVPDTRVPFSIKVNPFKHRR